MIDKEKRDALRAQHQGWLNKDSREVSAGQRADSTTIIELLNELDDMWLLHTRTAALVFPGERDSPGAYRKLLKDTEQERDEAVQNHGQQSGFWGRACARLVTENTRLQNQVSVLTRINNRLKYSIKRAKDEMIDAYTRLQLAVKEIEEMEKTNAAEEKDLQSSNAQG